MSESLEERQSKLPSSCCAPQSRNHLVFLKAFFGVFGLTKRFLDLLREYFLHFFEA